METHLYMISRYTLSLLSMADTYRTIETHRCQACTRVLDILIDITFQCDIRNIIIITVII